MRSAILMVFISASGLLQATSVLAAQRPSEMPLYAGEIDRFLSPNELQLAELQRERQDLLQQRENEKNIHILKNKITILNNKIAFLQRQIKLTRPYMVTQRLVPIKAKGAQFAERLEPVQAPVPVVLPRRLTPQALTPAASRESAAVKTLPIKMTPQTFKAVSARESAAERKQGAGKTGAEWKKMARADKEIYILSVMGNLSRHDVYLMKPYNFYIDTIDQAVEKNPLLEQEFVQRILMATAYESEPDTRKDLEKVWK